MKESVSQAAQEKLTEWKMAIAPASNHTDGIDFKELLRYLKSSMGIHIELIHCKDYGEAVQLLQDGVAQIGWLGHYAYLISSREGQVIPLALSVTKDDKSSSYRSLFITQSDSHLKSLVDVKNHRIAVGDSLSTSGYLIPKKELLAVGIRLDNATEFASIMRVKNHDEAISMVRAGSVDVAPVSSVNFQENIDEGIISPDEFCILHQSEDIPGAPLVCSHTLDAKQRDQLRDHLLQAHKHVQLRGYGGKLKYFTDPVESHRKYLESHLRPQWGLRVYVTLLVTVLFLVAISRDLEIDLTTAFSDGPQYIVDIISRMLPPDFSRLETFLLSMLETIEMAILGTVLAIILSVPLGFLTARNVNSHQILLFITRTVVIFFRAIPEFIMAMVLVIAIGFGALPGILALGLHTMGFLAKFYGEDIEHVAVGPIEALESTGASKMQVIMFAIVPQIIPSFVGNNLYILDRNIRMATMLGIVGAGGIGYELQSAFRMFRYPEVSAIIIIIFVTIFLIDLLSSYIRSRIA